MFRNLFGFVAYNLRPKTFNAASDTFTSSSDFPPLNAAINKPVFPIITRPPR